MWGFFIVGIFQKNTYICDMAEVDYNKLRLDVLEKLIYSRGIECKMNKTEMIRTLKLDDEGKYKPPMKETTYEKSEGGYVVSIDLANQSHLTQMGNLILKKEAKNLHRFANGSLYYWSKQKLI
jgi:hypothetical protein